MSNDTTTVTTDARPNDPLPDPPEWDENWAVRADDEDAAEWVVEYDYSDAAAPETVVVEATPEEVLAGWDDFRRHAIAKQFTEESLLDGVEKVYSTSQVAKFFGRSNQWVYWGLRPDARTGEQVFTYKDGRPIQPERVGKGSRRRFTLPIIREIALSCFRRGQIKEEELTAIMAKILLAEFGPQAFADTDAVTSE